MDFCAMPKKPTILGAIFSRNPRKYFVSFETRKENTEGKASTPKSGVVYAVEGSAQGRIRKRLHAIANLDRGAVTVHVRGDGTTYVDRTSLENSKQYKDQITALNLIAAKNAKKTKDPEAPAT